MPTTFDTRLTDALVDQHTATGAWKNRLLLDDLEEWAQKTPDSVVIHDPYGSHTYAQLRADVGEAARAFVAAGVQPTDVIGVQLPNRYEWVVIHLAAQQAEVADEAPEDDAK